MTFVVDTNVLVVANDRESPQVAPECVLSCARKLHQITRKDRIALDQGGLILEEYKRYSRWSGQPGVGDAFFKWVIDHYWRHECCDLVAITPRDDSFEEFPEDERLARFDLADRKFIAVAAAHPEHPPVLQAVDTKWVGFTQVLASHGVIVEFLCA